MERHLVGTSRSNEFIRFSLRWMDLEHESHSYESIRSESGGVASF